MSFMPPLFRFFPLFPIFCKLMPYPSTGFHEGLQEWHVSAKNWKTENFRGILRTKFNFSSTRFFSVSLFFFSAPSATSSFFFPPSLRLHFPPLDSPFVSRFPSPHPNLTEHTTRDGLFFSQNNSFAKTCHLYPQMCAYSTQHGINLQKFAQ